VTIPPHARSRKTWKPLPLFGWPITTPAFIQVWVRPSGDRLGAGSARTSVPPGHFQSFVGGRPTPVHSIVSGFTPIRRYIMIMPGMGIISESSAASGKRIFGYKAMAWQCSASMDRVLVGGAPHVRGRHLGLRPLIFSR